MRNSKLLAFFNNNCNITQVNIEGISKDDIRQLCLQLIKEQLTSLRKDASEIFYRQVEEFVELFYQSLAEIAENYDVLSKLKTPAVQFALDESLLIYSKHPTTEEKELQVELLIDKITTDDNSTKGIIIDLARLELCNLTNAHISMLAFLVSCDLECDSNDKNEIFDFFHRFESLLNDIQSMKKVDYTYLQHTNCLHRVSFVDKPDFIEKSLFSRYSERTGHSSEDNFKCYLNTISPQWSTVLDGIRDNDMACYKPTAVGYYIGLKRLSKFLDINISFDELYR